MLHNSKKSKKSLLTAWLLTAVMLLQLVPALSVFATETAKSGTDGNINWTISDGVLTVSGNGAIRDYTVWSDPTPWFEDRLEYNAIVVEEGVTAIGDYAFAYSSALTSVTLPDSLTYIGNGAFEYCSGSPAVTLPEGVTTVGEWAFAYWSELETLTLPATLISIGNGAFEVCDGLTTVSYTGTESQWNEISIGTQNNELVNAEIDFLGIPSGTDGNISWIIEDGVLTVSGNGAMRDYAPWSDPAPWFDLRLEYTAIVVEEGVTAIGDFAFAYSSVSTSVSLPDTLFSIGDGAFEYCSNLKSITLPENVAVIGEWVFDYDSNLKTVYYEGSEADWNEITLGAANDGLMNAEIVFLADISTAILGDANGDGAVDAMDAARILMMDAGLVELTEADFAACDVNGDGAVDSMDAARILMFDAGLIEKL